MDFRKVLILNMMLLSACSVSYYRDKPETYLVGQKLETSSSLTTSTGEDRDRIVVFDETTRRVHEFDIEKMVLLNSLAVAAPEEQHYLLYHDQGNYIVDLTEKHLTVFDKARTPNHEPIDFHGVPISAALNSKSGLFVMYDSLSTLGILKLSPEGTVLQGAVRGSVFENDTTVSAGDMTSDGKLVLALSSQEIAVVDLEQTLNLKDGWSFSKFASGLKGISWVAPFPDQPDLVFVKSVDTLSIVDILQKTVVSMDISNFVVDKLSKGIQPHVVVKEDTLLSNPKSFIAYPDSTQVHLVKVPDQDRSILLSHLDLAKNRWISILGPLSETSVYNDANQKLKNRTLQIFEFSTLKGIGNKALPDQAKLHPSSSFILAMFPSELGYAVRYDMTSDETREIRLFNLGDL